MEEMFSLHMYEISFTVHIVAFEVKDVQWGIVREDKILGILYLLFSGKIAQNPNLCFPRNLKTRL